MMVEHLWKLGFREHAREKHPTEEGGGRKRNDSWDKVARYAVSERLNRSLGRLCIFDKFDNLCERSVLPRTCDNHVKSAEAVDCPSDNGITDLFKNWDRLAGDSTFINTRSASHHGSIGRYLVSRNDLDSIPNLKEFCGYFLFLST